FLVEHFTDGDMFDNTVEPGWAPLTASGLYQWGPPPSKDFFGVRTPRETAREVALMLDALRHDNEFDVSALRGLLTVTKS
ncbi:MAG: 2,3-dihydroxybiphenyl 1,2-dioxygenase, partial [Mycolicibacterium sp.]|nr:2,3-dihydroxybiphenyl 1,2-dioxygenase [Mycolicibacterium sp.]